MVNLVEEVWKTMNENFKYQPNHFHYYNMIKLLLASEKVVDAVKLIDHMKKNGIEPSNIIYSMIISKCSKHRNIELVQQLLNYVDDAPVDIKRKVYQDNILNTALIDLYGSYGKLSQIEDIFNVIPMKQCDVVAYSSMMKAYIRCDKLQLAIGLFKQMKQSGIKPDPVTYTILLSGCIDVHDLNNGKLLHQQMIREGIRQTIELKSTLIYMYGHCGDLDHARTIFDGIPLSQRTVVAWNTMIRAFTKTNNLNLAIDLLNQMNEAGVEPSAVTYNILLSACAESGDFNNGRILHKKLVTEGILLNVYLLTVLVKLYGNFGDLEQACSIFDIIPIDQRNIVAWNSILKAHVKCGKLNEAVELLHKMVQTGINPDPVTYIILFTACADQHVLDIGITLHKRLVEDGIEQSITLKNTILTMYVNCGDTSQAVRVFDTIPLDQRDISTWNSMVKIHITNNEMNLAVDILDVMVNIGVKPDAITYIILLTGCADLCIPKLGFQLHDRLVRDGIHQTTQLKNALINMYGKCGKVEQLENMFNTIEKQERDRSTWGTMLQMYAVNGLGQKAMQLFQKMIEECPPDAIHFLSILNACSHSLLANDALNIYRSMKDKWNIVPNSNHTVCLVDTLSRCGRLEEAESLILENIPDNSIAWMTLLSPCRLYPDVARAKRAYDGVKRYGDKEHVASAHVMIANIYGMTGDRGKQRETRIDMKINGLKKTPCTTKINVNGKVEDLEEQQKLVSSL
jgi:pentatricopeptide repeat protein